MKQTHRAYDHARQRVLDAHVALAAAFERHGIGPCPPPSAADGDDPEPADLAEARRALGDAHEALAAATEAVQPELDAAWDANREAVETTRAAITDALQDQARVEIDCGTAARHRAEQAKDPTLPTLNAAEQARVVDARSATSSARDAHQAAREAFKTGITVEQLAEQET